MAGERCTCGFEIPAEAEYCPGCGRPVTEEALERDRAANAFPVPREDPDEPAPAAEISFRNRDALRACYWNAVIASFFANMIGSPLLTAIWAGAASVFSVGSYMRRTARALTFGDGARLGAMTGALIYGLTLLLNAFGALVIEDPAAALVSLSAPLAPAWLGALWCRPVHARIVVEVADVLEEYSKNS